MKMGNKISNRTKAFGITTLILGAATAVTLIKDQISFKAPEEDAFEVITESAGELVDELADGVSTIEDVIV